MSGLRCRVTLSCAGLGQFKTASETKGVSELKAQVGKVDAGLVEVRRAVGNYSDHVSFINMLAGLLK